MSQDALRDILEQLVADSAFRARIEVDPEGTIGSHDLTAAEQDALLSWDPAQIEAALSAPLTAEQQAIVADLGPSAFLTDSPAAPPATDDDAPPWTPGGRLSSDGYRKHEHKQE
jgi:hypothetical protein